MDNTIDLAHVAFYLTLKCTLRCKLCSTLVPYLTKGYHPPLESLKFDIDNLFKIVDTVQYINITGGEPLLRGGVHDIALFSILEYLGAISSHRLEVVRIYTSATIVPTDDLCKAFQEISAKKTFWLEIDDYGHSSTKMQEVTAKLDHYSIKYKVRDYVGDSDTLYYNGWVDLHTSPDPIHHAKHAKTLFDQCACGSGGRNSIGFFDGVMLACPATSVRYMCGEIDKTHGEVIDCRGDIDLMRKKWLTLNTSPYYESCHYCKDGVCAESKRFAPAVQAIQDDVVAFHNIHPKMCY